ncbi:MAG: conjugal transfer protein, partial [Wolbachia sp.]
KVERELGTELVRDNHDQPLEEGDPLRLRGGGQPDKVVRELGTERYIGKHAEEKEKRDLEGVYNLKPLFKEPKDPEEYVKALFEMNTKEAVEKRAERARRKKEREDREGEVYNLKPLFKEPKNPERKLPEPMRKPDAKGDEKRIEDED